MIKNETLQIKIILKKYLKILKIIPIVKQTFFLQNTIKSLSKTIFLNTSQ